MEKFDSDRDGWEIDIFKHPHQFGYMLRIGRRASKDAVDLASLRMVTVDGPAVGTPVMDNSTALTEEQCQQLIDCLWSLEIRPSGYGDSATISQARDAILKIADKLGVELDDQPKDANES